MAEQHRIVVVGGGAGGLELATALGKSLGRHGRAEILMVDRSRTHVWKPLLHVIAAGSMDPADYQVNFQAQGHFSGFSFRYGEMSGLDRAGKLIQLNATVDEEGREITPRRSIRYDTLIIAVGSVTNDFGTPGVAQYAVPLDTPEQAARFNRRLLNALVRAQTQNAPVRRGQLHVAIIGAGATGSELSAELHRTARQIVAFGLNNIDPARDIHITLLEAAERILPALPERVSDATAKLLQSLGVEVRTNARVAEVMADGVRLATGEVIPSELVVWAAGVKAPDFLRDIDGLETNRANQLLTRPTLQTTRDDAVFAMGDCAAVPLAGSDWPVPPRAQAAHQEASHLARQMRRLLAGKPLQPYRYRDFGSLVSLGRYSTVGSLMGFMVSRSFFIEGYFARLMYRSLYKMHEYALYGAWKTLLGTLSRSLARRGGEPQVKLH